MGSGGIGKSVAIPAGQWDCYVRMRGAGATAELYVELYSGGNYVVNEQQFWANSFEADRWFVLGDKVYGFKRIAQNLNGGASWIFQVQTGVQPAILDSVMFATQDEGFATEAEAIASMNPEEGIQQCMVGLHVFAGQPTLLINVDYAQGGDGTHEMGFDAGGTWFSTGDLSAEELHVILGSIRGTHHVNSEYEIGGVTITNGGWVWEWFSADGSGGHLQQRTDVAQFTLSERLFSEVAYQVLAADKLPGYDQAALAAIWNSENRFRIYGDHLGDIAYRLHVELLEQSGGTP